MKTLIELFDERPLENVLAANVFRPERIIYLCDTEIAQDRELQQYVREYFSSRGEDVELVFLEASMYKANKIARQIQNVAEKYPDCAIDIAGGTDAALFAAGEASGSSGIPVFTYSRKKNRFFNIHNAEFAEIPCTLQYSMKDFARMAGGRVREGRFDDTLSQYTDLIDSFFAVYMRHRKGWKKFIEYMQKVSGSDKDGRYSLDVNAPYTAKGDRGSRLSADPALLKELESIGLISHLKINGESSVSFRFRDDQCRFWLRDIGSVLELYTYKSCLDTGLFNDVRCSTIIDWDSFSKRDSVSNEVDVIAVRSVIPWFISCKVCNVETSALNELTILRDRFGGNGAGAILVSCEKCRAATRNRAQALDITIIDLDDLIHGKLSQRIVEIINGEN